MVNPNLEQYELPELPRNGDRLARTWAEQALAGVVQRAYINAKSTRSRLTDVVIIPPGPQRQQPQPTVAERIINAQTYVAPREAAAPYYGGSQAARANAAAYVPDRLSPEEQEQSIAEMAKLAREVDSFRARVGMPVRHPEAADATVVAPVMTAAPEALITPMRQVEEQLPGSDAEQNYNGKPVGQLLEEIDALHQQEGSE